MAAVAFKESVTAPCKLSLVPAAPVVVILGVCTEPVMVALANVSLPALVCILVGAMAPLTPG